MNIPLKITTKMISTARLPKLVAAAALVLLSAAPGARAEQEVPTRVIRVSGSAVAKAAPDRARVAVSVVSRAATAQAATAANAKASKLVLEKLQSLVKAPGEVSTAGYDLSAEYDYNRPETGGRHQPTPIGYLVTNRFAVVTADLAEVGRLIDAAVEAGATQIDSISFFLDSEDAPRKQALTQAGQKARAEAETIAASLGVTLGEVLDASSTSAASPAPIYGHPRAKMAMGDMAMSTEMVPGSLDIEASITVTFAIR